MANSGVPGPCAVPAHRNSNNEDVVKALMRLTQGRGVDVVIENVGAAGWLAAMKSLVRGGRLVTCGATTGDQPPADLRRSSTRPTPP